MTDKSKDLISPQDGISRRELIIAGGVAALGAALPAFAAPGKPKFKGQTLRIFVYSGAWENTMREAFIPKFEAMTGAKVVLDPGWWDSIPKLKASPKGKPAFDLVLTDATQGYPAIKEGLFQKVEMSRIENRKRMADSALDHWVYKEGFGIPFPDSVMTLAYHKELVKKEPKSWGDLLDADNAGKLGLYNSFYMSLYTFACMKVASDGKAGTAAAWMEKDLDGVLNYAIEQKKLVKYWWPTSTDMALNLTQKNCSLGNMHSTDMLPAMKGSAVLGALVPKEDAAFVQLMWVVPTGTKRKDLAEEAMNYLIGDEMQTEFAVRGAATGNLTAAKAAAAKDPMWAQFYPSTAEALQSVKYYPYDVYAKNWDRIVKIWDREVLRKQA